jgi:hypothetical protein
MEVAVSPVRSVWTESGTNAPVGGVRRLGSGGGLADGLGFEAEADVPAPVAAAPSGELPPPLSGDAVGHLRVSLDAVV